MRKWTWSDKLLTEWYQLMLKLNILRLDMRVEDVEIEGDEKIVNLICEPHWFWERKKRSQFGCDE